MIDLAGLAVALDSLTGKAPEQMTMVPYPANKSRLWVQYERVFLTLTADGEAFEMRWHPLHASCWTNIHSLANASTQAGGRKGYPGGTENTL
ncbi:MAG: hypothetical protein HOI95_00860 [Chromatiales bacterium]|nr:hypothetical protein [Chromatiales bacterium]